MLSRHLQLLHRKRLLHPHLLHPQLLHPQLLNPQLLYPHRSQQQNLCRKVNRLLERKLATSLVEESSPRKNLTLQFLNSSRKCEKFKLIFEGDSPRIEMDSRKIIMLPSFFGTNRSSKLLMITTTVRVHIN